MNCETNQADKRVNKCRLAPLRGPFGGGAKHIHELAILESVPETILTEVGSAESVVPTPYRSEACTKIRNKVLQLVTSMLIGGICLKQLGTPSLGNNLTSIKIQETEREF